MSEITSTSFETPVGSLLKTVFASILEVFLLCIAGYILAGRGILDKKTQKQLNRLNVSLFTPSLLFSKVAFVLSPEKLRELWIIPIFFVIVTVASMAIAFLLGWIFRLKGSQRSFAMAAAMFMNSNSLPIALMQSLVATVPGLKWGDDDTNNAMLGRALTYLVLYSTLGMVLRWSYGVKLLSQADIEQETVKPPAEVNERSPLLPHFQFRENYTSTHLIYDSSDTDHEQDQDTPTATPMDEADSVPHVIVQGPSRANSSSNGNVFRPPRPRRQTTFFKSFPNSPNQSVVHLPQIESCAASAAGSPTPSTPYSDTGGALPNHIHCHRRSHSLHTSSQVFIKRCRRRIVGYYLAFNDFMTVPLWAAFASILVACLQPLQHLLNAHMKPVKHALSSAGNCSIPLTLIVLGAYFYPSANGEGEVAGARDSQTLVTSRSSTSLMDSVRGMFGVRKASLDSLTEQRAFEQQKAREGETMTVIIAVASRMILTPLVLLPMMALSTKFDLQAVFDDPVFVVSNVLLISSPPALTLAQITQAASGDAFERLISRTIFWAYCVVTPPATIAYVVIGLVLAKL